MPRTIKRIQNYLLVAKPGIVFGNLICAAAGFFLASRGRIDPGLLLWTMLGISLVVASGCVFNNCIDKKMDRKMRRTRHRVLARGLMSPTVAVCYACLLCLAGAATLWAAANRLSLAVTLAGFAVYVGVYSLYLKRTSIYGALVGSLAGAAPPLAGYCAVSNCVSLEALILLSLFTLWQMPHCYAIAIFRCEDYAAADIPVLPLERGLPAAKRQIAAYISAFMAVALMLPLGGYTGYGYLAVATVLALSWLYLIWTGYRAADERIWARKVFLLSMLSIFALSLMMSIDYTAPAGTEMLLTCAPLN